MARRGDAQRGGRRTSLLLAIVVLLLVGCAAQPVEPPTAPAESTEPTMVGEPLPGSFHMTSDPPQAPYAMTIRLDDIGGPSRRTAEFAEGGEVVVDWSTLPLPPAKWIEVNGQDCEGTFTVQARFETDLLLILIDDTCRVEVIGTHIEDGPHHPPGA